MEISHRRPLSLNSNLPTSPAAPSLPILCPKFGEMYSMDRVPANCDSKGERMYSTSHTMGVHNSSQNMVSPKQENVIQSAFNALTNMLGEHLERGTSLLFPNVNSSISVTIVQNGGLIPDGFFKTFTGSTEKIDRENYYNTMTQNKESLIFGDNFYNCAVDGKTLESVDDYYKNTNINTPTSIVSLDSKINDVLLMSNKTESIPEKSFDALEKSEKLTEDCAFITGKSALNEANVVPKPEQASTRETKEQSTVCGSEKIDATRVYESPDKTHSSKAKDSRTSDLNHSNDSSPTTGNFYQTVFSNLLTDLSGMVHKVMNHVTDRVHGPALQSSDSEVPERSCSPKPRCKQIPVNVSRGRGRGRGRAQLRRSGVSQARHRQERIRQSLNADIQEDLDDWHEFEELQYEDLPSTPSVDEHGTQILYGADGTSILESMKCPLSFTVFELKPRKRKQKKNKNVDNSELMKVPTRVRYLSDPSVDVDFCKRIEEVEEFKFGKIPFRPRLLSESSVDSEDSCCIVFETGSDSEYETDYDYDSTSEEDEDVEHPYEAANRTPRQKVRFNMKPTIHTMYKWDYAYRTARRGPWEEMARDRERFRGRIHSVGRVLDPILTPQHRSHVWQQRFATEASNEPSPQVPEN